MNISVILAHPDITSFNHAIAGTVVNKLKENGHKVNFHDLYQEKFDPLLFHDEFLKEASLPNAIARHCREIECANGIVIVHPNWWGQPPAILKGWIDRIIRPGVAYEFLEEDSGEGVPQGLLKTDVAVVFNTSNTPAEREETVFGDPLQRIWKDCIFDLCGVTSFYRKMFQMVVTSTKDERMQWLKETEETANRFFPLA